MFAHALAADHGSDVTGREKQQSCRVLASDARDRRSARFSVTAPRDA
jgi:hypothetical protein